jgi:hypothetical protein
MAMHSLASRVSRAPIPARFGGRPEYSAQNDASRGAPNVPATGAHWVRIQGWTYQKGSPDSPAGQDYRIIGLLGLPQCTQGAPGRRLSDCGLFPDYCRMLPKLDYNPRIRGYVQPCPHHTMMPTISPDSPRPERSKTVEKPGVGAGQTHQQFISRKSGYPYCPEYGIYRAVFYDCRFTFTYFHCEIKRSPFGF